jgi:hypothetical protein
LKKHFAIILVLIILLVSCQNTPGTTDESGLFSEISADVSEISEVNEVSDLSIESGISEQEKAEFIANARRLLEADAEITSLIINGEIYKDEQKKDGGTVLYPLSAENKYYEFSKLEELVYSVYTKEGGEYIINFPTYGTGRVVSVSGKTWYSTHFAPDFNDHAKSIKLISLNEKSGRVEVKTENGYTVNINFENTSAGWRMSKGLYQAVTEFKHTVPSGDEVKSTAMNMGSAKTLTGKCLVINVFLSDSVSSWKDDDIKVALSRLNKARDFTVSLASFYGGSLDLTATDQTTSLYIETKDKIPTDISDFVWIDLLFCDTVYGSLEGYAESHFDLESYDNWCVLFHLNKKGRSYAIPCDKANSDWQHYYAERCVVFHTTDQSYQYYNSPGVYAHELFHLFGASDLYTPYISDEDAKLLYNYFPNDIMNVIPLDLELASVSPFTAYRMGWLDYLDEQFYFLTD